MSNIFVFLCAATMALSGVSAEVKVVERINLWPSLNDVPDRQTHQKAVRHGEKVRAGAEGAMPYLEWYTPVNPSNNVSSCIILLGGGGYNVCAGKNLFNRIAGRLIERGVTCVSLVYRTPRPKGCEIYRSAWQDAQRAVRLVRSLAKQRGYSEEKIGVLGFSAGAHLSVLLATSSQSEAYAAKDRLDEVPCHINWAVPLYPAYSLSDGLSGPNTRNGDSPDVVLSSAFKFDAKTCSMCLFHAGKDIHSPIASTKIYRKLRTRKIPSELHLYPDLGHDFFSAAKPGTGAYSWFDRVEEYLMQMGFLGNIAKKERIFERYPSDEDRKTYEKEFIWPKGKIPDVQTHQDGLPYIEWHIPSNLTTKAIQIIFSGGSYNSNSPESSEVMPVRRYLNAKGMTVVTMCYRSPRPFAPLMKHASAWQDLQRAVRIVRSQAARRGLDPDRIGIMGSSAGGHLALLGAVSSLSRSYGDIDETDGISCSVQWAVAVYPAYTIVQGVGTRIISNEIHEAFPLETLSKELAFDKATCPVLFIHGDKDTTVTAICSVAPWEHMRKIGVQSELHTFAHANHSFERLTSPGTGAYSYMDRIWEFLTAKGLK